MRTRRFPRPIELAIPHMALACCLSCVGVVHAQSPQAVVETKILPEGDLAYKRRCELVVRFLTDGFAFVKPPVFPDIRIGGAIVIPPTSGMNFSERRAGDTWVGIERRYAVYPARSGVLQAPAVRLKAEVRSPDGVSTVSAASPPLEGRVAVPPEMRQIPQAVVTPKLTIQQVWEPDVNEMKVGEAIQRTVTISAEDTTAMLLPPLPAADVNGLSLYAGQPVLDDRDVRGSISAKRTDSITYVCERTGVFLVPEVTVRWWHPRTRELHEEVVPGRTCAVEENPALAASEAVREPEIPERKAPTRALWLILIPPVSGVIVWTLVRFWGAGLKTRWTFWRQARAESEGACFRCFQRACAQNDPQLALKTLRDWLDRCMGTDWTLEAFCERVELPALQRSIDALNGHLFGGGTSAEGGWLGQELSAAASKARSVVLHRQRTIEKETLLCEMYPTSPEKQK